MAKVNEIAVVWQNLVAAIAVLFTGHFEFLNHVLRQRSGFPLALILGKQRERRGFQLVCANNGLIDTARRADMCSNKLMFIPLLCSRISWDHSALGVGLQHRSVK